MTEEKKPETDELLQEAVEKAMATPHPEEKKKEDRLPYLFEQVARDFRKGLKKNKFRVGSKSQVYTVKVDENGAAIPHGNGGVVVIKNEKKN